MRQSQISLHSPRWGTVLRPYGLVRPAARVSSQTWGLLRHGNGPVWAQLDAGKSLLGLGPEHHLEVSGECPLRRPMLSDLMTDFGPPRQETFEGTGRAAVPATQACTLRDVGRGGQGSSPSPNRSDQTGLLGQFHPLGAKLLPGRARSGDLARRCLRPQPSLCPSRRSACPRISGICQGQPAVPLLVVCSPIISVQVPA